MPHPPTIENQTGQPFRYEFIQVIQQIFTDYERVVIKAELSGGLSGGRVFLVRPIRRQGAERPSVVKIDDHNRIEREWQAYHNCIENRLGEAAEIRGEPVYPRGLTWGGLRYPLVGAGTFDITSLHQYYRSASLDDIRHVLENRLFHSLETLWKGSRRADPEYFLRGRYDAILPSNLVVEKLSAPVAAPLIFYKPDSVLHQPVKSGDYVQLSDFRVSKLDPQAKQLSLNTPEGSPVAHRLELTHVDEIELYHVNQLLPQPILGVVRQTRADYLLAQAQNVLGAEVDLAAATLTPYPHAPVPNPLVQLPDVLQQSFDVEVGYIHGDLNLENVLVEPQNRNAFLIDFALARHDHILHDPLRMELAVITRLLPELFQATKQGAAQIIPFYDRLHCALARPQEISPPVGLEKPFLILQLIRQVAQRHLHRSDSWTEYYHGLVIYLLGALRFSDLDRLPTTPLPKQMAFWGAAAILRLLQQQPNCTDLISSSAPPQTTQTPQPGTPPTNVTHFHGPVTGPVYTGSGNIQADTYPQTETIPPPPLRYHTQKRLALRQILWDHFNLSELQDLCLELGIDYDNLPGSTKADKIRELILYGERYGQSEAILQAAYRARPQANWQVFQS